jgi:hypothetical protein
MLKRVDLLELGPLVKKVLSEVAMILLLMPMVLLDFLLVLMFCVVYFKLGHLDMIVYL